MREYDHNGLLLSEYQGKLFEKSSDLNCSTGVFIRRFLHSELLEKLDSNNSSLLSLDTNEGMNCIMEQFGESEYGKIKFSPDSLFWIGYLYRSVSYTREVSTKFILKTFDYRQMNEVYYTYHTQDPEWCIRNLLQLNNLSEDYFDNNYRLKEVIKSRTEKRLRAYKEKM